MSTLATGPAVPAERPRPAPLAALALVVAVPATFVVVAPVRFWTGSGTDAARGWILFACGAVVVVLVGRGAFGVVRALVVAVSSWCALGFAYVIWLFALFAEAFASCDQPTIHHPFDTTVAILAAAVYAVCGFWTLRKGWWWGPPLAILVSVAFGFALAEALPGVPNPNYPNGCSS